MKGAFAYLDKDYVQSNVEKKLSMSYGSSIGNGVMGLVIFILLLLGGLGFLGWYVLKPSEPVPIMTYTDFIKKSEGHTIEVLGITEFQEKIFGDKVLILIDYDREGELFSITADTQQVASKDRFIIKNEQLQRIARP